MFDEKSYKLAMAGEIVSTKSALAFDEDILCRKCGHTFTLAESNYEAAHQTYPSVKVVGMQCPGCKNVNITYVKTPTLMALEHKLNNAPLEKRKKLRAKYQREFTRVQKEFMGA